MAYPLRKRADKKPRTSGCRCRCVASIYTCHTGSRMPVLVDAFIPRIYDEPLSSRSCYGQSHGGSGEDKEWVPVACLTHGGTGGSASARRRRQGHLMDPIMHNRLCPHLCESPSSPRTVPHHRTQKVHTVHLQCRRADAQSD